MGEALDALVVALAFGRVHVKGHKRVTAKGNVVDVDAYVRSLRGMSDLELEREANSTSDRARAAQIANEVRRRSLSRPVERDPKWGIDSESAIATMQDKLNRNHAPTRVWKRMSAAEIADERQKNIWFKRPEDPSYGPAENGDQLARRPDRPKGDLLAHTRDTSVPKPFSTTSPEMIARRALNERSAGKHFTPQRGKAVQKIFRAFNNGSSEDIRNALSHAREVFDGDDMATKALDVLERVQ